MRIEYAKSDLAWAAGFFDGEGCIHISREELPQGSRFGLVVQVNQTSTKPLAFLQELFGGKISILTRREGCKQQWLWRLYGPETSNFLEAVLPYLQVKDSEAGLALIFQATFNDTYEVSGNSRKPLPGAVVELRAAACEACRDFKKINL